MNRRRWPTSLADSGSRTNDTCSRRYRFPASARRRRPRRDRRAHTQETRRSSPGARGRTWHRERGTSRGRTDPALRARVAFSICGAEARSLTAAVAPTGMIEPLAAGVAWAARAVGIEERRVGRVPDRACRALSAAPSSSSAGLRREVARRASGFAGLAAAGAPARAIRADRRRRRSGAGTVGIEKPRGRVRIPRPAPKGVRDLR
jgi:hypothetical protein